MVGQTNRQSRPIRRRQEVPVPAVLTSMDAPDSIPLAATDEIPLLKHPLAAALIGDERLCVVPPGLRPLEMSPPVTERQPGRRSGSTHG